MQVSRVAYQNNRNWAVANKTRGKNATLYSIGATAFGCTKVFTEKNSFSSRVLDFGQKALEALRNFEQYSLYKREDDDVANDKEHRPIAGNIGELACNYETIVNPVAVPAASIIGGNIGDSYSVISNWLNSMWWRIRPTCEKINWNDIKFIHSNIEKLFHREIELRKLGRKGLVEIFAPIFGLAGCFFAGIFIPIKAWNRLKENENKWIDACADSAFLTQHSLYFLKFTLNELLEAQETNNQNRWYLFGAGLSANIMNIGLPIVDILPLSDTTKTLWKEIAQGLARVFFSSRRFIKGKEWLGKN